jgi:hypothetical protein
MVSAPTPSTVTLHRDVSDLSGGAALPAEEFSVHDDSTTDSRPRKDADHVAT